MKTIQIFNIVLMGFLLGLYWLASQNSSLLFEYSTHEAERSKYMLDHVKQVLTGEKEKTVGNLLGVIEKTAKASMSGSKVVRSSANSISYMKWIILGQIIWLIFSSILYYKYYKKNIKQEDV